MAETICCGCEFGVSALGQEMGFQDTQEWQFLLLEQDGWGDGVADAIWGRSVCDVEEEDARQTALEGGIVGGQFGVFVYGRHCADL